MSSSAAAALLVLLMAATGSAQPAETPQPEEPRPHANPAVVEPAAPAATRDAKTDRRPQRTRVVTLRDEWFAREQPHLLPVAKTRLAETIAAFRATPGARVLVQGHMADADSQVAGQQLSLQRAYAVRQYLIANAVPAERIVARAYGTDLPGADNPYGVGLQEPRRVDVMVYQAGKQSGARPPSR